MQTKRTTIPAGTPGTFRTGWGQFPELGVEIIAWFTDGVSRNLIALPDHILPHIIYAWQYAPVAPPVDGLEAFKAGWEPHDLGFVHANYTYSTRGQQLHGRTCSAHEKIGNFPTLAAAQEAAYAHFLSTLNS